MYLRPATAQDEALLRALHAAARAPDFAATGLPPTALQALLAMQYEAQSRAYAAQYPGAIEQIIELQGRPVGYLWRQQTAPRLLRLLDIGLLPAWRSHGLGTRILRRLQQDARVRGQTLLLQVAEDNPARRLYERLGFVAQQCQGLHLQMYWRAETPPGRQPMNRIPRTPGEPP